jgi:hypothetical protein
MARLNLLVVVLEDGWKNELRREIAARNPEPTRVHVVAPTRVRALEWLATDESEARHEARRRAVEAEWTLADETNVDAGAGDADPVLAIEDALRGFPANEILVVGAPADDGTLASSLHATGLPVSWIGAAPAPADRQPPFAETAHAVVTGRRRAAPSAYFTAVSLIVLTLAAAIVGVALLVAWLQ